MLLKVVQIYLEVDLLQSKFAIRGLPAVFIDQSFFSPLFHSIVGCLFDVVSIDRCPISLCFVGVSIWGQPALEQSFQEFHFRHSELKL